MRLLFFAKAHGTDGGGQGHRQHDADGAGHGGDGLQAHVGGAQQLPGLQAQGVDVDHQGQAAAQDGQDQGVGHGAHHIPADVHAGAEQLPHGKGFVGGADLAHGGADAHGHIHHRAQCADGDAACAVAGENGQCGEGADDNGSEVTFTIASDGTLSGHVKEYIPKDSKIESTGEAKLLISIQTGIKKINNFNNTEFYVESIMGPLLLKGEMLELVKMDTFKGNLNIKGRIISINYLEENKKLKADNIMARLFK